MCSPAAYLCHHRPSSSNPTLWIGCSTHTIPFYRNRLIHLSWKCKPNSEFLVAKNPQPIKVFCQRYRDKWEIGGLYEEELMKSVLRVDEELKDTGYKLTGKEIQEGLRKAGELFGNEGLRGRDLEIGVNRWVE